MISLTNDKPFSFQEKGRVEFLTTDKVKVLTSFLEKVLYPNNILDIASLIYCLQSKFQNNLMTL